jgi:DNA-binding transcriptional regulator LsrR (DeoR family)
MYEYIKVLNGITTYIDKEIIDKINGWQKWVVGSGIGIAMSNSTNVFNELKNNQFIKMLGIINKDDKIDVDKIYKEFKKQAKKSAITFDAPLIGTITLTEQDVDKLYEYIKE